MYHVNDRKSILPVFAMHVINKKKENHNQEMILLPFFKYTIQKNFNKNPLCL